MIDKPNLLIVTWHQVYLTSSAGGYVRLKEFLKRVPPNLKFILLDNKPSIYLSECSKGKLVQYDTPKLIKPIMSKLFVMWYLLESFFAIIILYRTSIASIKKNNINVIYFPIGELTHLYIVALLLKFRFPKKKIVMDILNFGMRENARSYYKKLRKNGIGVVKSGAFILISVFQHYFLIPSTINKIDYIFTVSPELVKDLKKIYKKNTIDYTPSGVSPVSVHAYNKKKFLSIYVGRMTVEKGIFEILNVWKLVIDKNPTALVAFAGSASDDLILQMRKKAQDLGILKNIYIFNKPTDKEKFSLLSRSEIFLHLARYEPLFPVIGILEGLSLGLPVITYNMEVVASQLDLKKRKCIFVVGNGDIAAVAKKITEYQNFNINKKGSIAKEAFAYSKLFSWNVIANKEFSIIKSLISN